MQHVLVLTKKQLHGWWPGKRECTAERMLINPYNGCEVGCFYCYSRALPGYFEKFHKEGKIFVSKDFDRVVSLQLDSLNVATCGYLSPVTDPFQPLNNKYKLSEKIIRVFIERNIPIEFITKARIPEEVIELLKGNKHCFGQISILTCARQGTAEEKLRKILSPQGASTGELFNNLERLAREDIFAVCRIDPILPYITDNKESLAKLVDRAVSSGAKHIIASVLDIPLKITDYVFNKIKQYFGSEIYSNYRKLYTERIGYLNAKIDYRKKIFDFLRNYCDRKKVTFALCMEYELKNIDGKKVPFGLNRQFMSSTNCEGIDIPVYIRKGSKFYPATDCKGNCLDCFDAKCGLPELALGKIKQTKWPDLPGFKLKDYRSWSKFQPIISR